MAVQFSVSVGGVFKPIKRAWVSVGGVFQEIKTIKASIGGAFHTVFDYPHVIQGLAYSLFNNTVGTAVAFLQFLSDGSTAESKTSGSGSNTGAPWFSPITAGAGTGRYVILIPSGGGGGTETGAARNTRIQISTAPSFGLQTSGGGMVTRTYTLQFWDSPSGGTMLASGTVSLSAEAI